MSKPLCRFVVLISGRGSNMRAIVNALKNSATPIGEVCAVISNQANAAGIEWAKQQGIPTQVIEHKNYNSRQEFDTELGNVIQAYKPDYILLAGFMRILTADLVNRFSNRIVNIHPSLLPAFPGLNTYQQALDTGTQWHGCTIHFVTANLDSGPIIAQGVVPVYAGDTTNTLAERVLSIEHHIYIQVVIWLAKGWVKLDQNHVIVENVASRAFMPSGNGVVLEGKNE